MDEVDAVIVMRVLLFVLHVCIMRESERVHGNAGVGHGGGVVVMSAVHVGGTCGSSFVSIADDVLWTCVLHGIIGVGGVCKMCMCLARGGVGGEESDWMS